ncbi:MAG TPA: O-antigen ligase family protein [Terrimesophilobacter sp.]|jgi:Lipid A core - O-antigen ligase and related enzymes|uniref:O-antigen ligase family protein n=1 Tax=Terrimesophilobacter sp. TaxID=2906435 RepID=UPI002F95EAD5
MLESPRFRVGFSTLLMFTLLAGDAWRYSISWYGFAVLAAALLTVSVILLVRQRDRWRLDGLPLPLLAFLVLATASIAWSHYPGASALGTFTTWATVTCAVAAAITFSWAELLRALGLALRAILGLSLLFEFVVSAFIGHPVLPFWVSYPEGELPKLLYWSRDLLFDGGKIQGIVGNSSLLAFAALLGVIVFGVQLATRGVGRWWGWFWMLVAVVCIATTRSATIYLGLVAVAFVLAAVLLVRRARTPRSRAGVYWGVIGVIAVGVSAMLVFGQQLLALVGKSPDLTGRIGIWDTVIGMAQQRPVFGWGWVSYWVPWVDPFDHLVFHAGVLQLHAHNAWLDVWMQLGILGLVVFGSLVLAALVKSWQHAVDRPQTAPDVPGAHTALTLLPLLILVALLIQSLAESRLLIEYGLLLLTIIAVKTKRRELT